MSNDITVQTYRDDLTFQLQTPDHLDWDYFLSTANKARILANKLDENMSDNKDKKYFYLCYAAYGNMIHHTTIIMRFDNKNINHNSFEQIKTAVKNEFNAQGDILITNISYLGYMTLEEFNNGE